MRRVEILLDDVAAGVGLGIARTHHRVGNVVSFLPVLSVVVIDLVDGEVLDRFANDEDGNRAALDFFAALLEELCLPVAPRPRRPHLRSLTP